MFADENILNLYAVLAPTLIRSVLKEQDERENCEVSKAVLHTETEKTMPTISLRKTC